MISTPPDSVRDSYAALAVYLGYVKPWFNFLSTYYPVRIILNNFCPFLLCSCKTVFNEKKLTRNVVQNVVHLKTKKSYIFM